MIKIKYIVVLILATMLILLMGCTSNKVPENNYTFLAEELYINDEIRIVDLLGLSKDELLLKFGENYILAQAIPDQPDSVGYKYPEHGIMFVFDHENIMLFWVEVLEGANINGASVGMNTAEILDILGEGEILDLGGHTRISHALRYVYEGFFLGFTLYPDEKGSAETILVNLWEI